MSDHLHVDFHCGRCRLRARVCVPPGMTVDLAVVQRYIVETHRAFSPDCAAPSEAIQLLKLYKLSGEPTAADARAEQRQARARAARSN